MELPIWLETGWIRIRTFARTAVRIAGLGILFLGIYNMFGAAMLDMPAVAPYRYWGLVRVGEASAYYIGDAVVMALGAAIAWFV